MMYYKVFKTQQSRSLMHPVKQSAPIWTGFTLLEMVVAAGLFSVVMITAIGAVLAIGNAQEKAKKVQIIQDNLRFTLEMMTKEMRIGRAFLPSSCTGSACLGMNFTVPERGDIPLENLGYYRSADGFIRKLPGDSVVTDENVFVDQLIFYVAGYGDTGGLQNTGDQIRITIALKAHSRDARLTTTFNLQTTITPRERGQ